MKKLLIMLLAVSFFPIPVLANDDVSLTKNATSAVLVEKSTGKVVYNKDANKKVSVASLTKIMGLVLIFEDLEAGRLKKDEIVTISKNAKDMGGTQIWVEEGEKISVDDLIKGVVLASANDAMVALAERISGTEAAFVNRMNKKAKELNLKNTNFKNCTGLDEENHYSSAYDVALISLELLKHDDAIKYTSTYEDYIRKNTDNKTWIVNTNKLLRFYEGTDGLKTGFTDNAGSCLAVTAKRDNLRFVGVVLGYKKSEIRNSEAMALLDYGFNQYQANVLYKKGDEAGYITIDKGKENKIPLLLKDDAIVVSKKSNEKGNYTYDIEIKEESLPIKKGTTLGIMYVKDNGKVVGSVDLLASKDVDKINIFSLYFRTLKDQLIGV